MGKTVPISIALQGLDHLQPPTPKEELMCYKYMQKPEVK